MAPRVDYNKYIGVKFANGWEVKRLTSKEEDASMGMGLHNRHFECVNNICGVITCFEKTTLDSYIKKGKDFVLFKCRKCNNIRHEGCPYLDKVRKQVGRDSVSATYTKKVQVGDVFGFFTVVKKIDSTELANHQSKVIAKCNICGAEKEVLNHHLFNHEVACDCFKQHSTGEFCIKNYLDKHNYKYSTEYVFEGLYGTGGGLLRYDFAIFDKLNNLVALIEFDGQQHFQEAGSYYNSQGQVQIHDEIKNKYAKENKIPLLRIPFTELLKVDEILEKFLSTYKNLF